MRNTLLLGLCLLYSCVAFSGHYKFYGDSLTAGHLAETNVSAPPPLFEISRIVSDFAKYWLTKDWSLVRRYARPHLSYGQRVVNLMGIENATNYGVIGARSSQLVNQILESDPHKEEVTAFFFIGHNDLNTERKGVAKDFAKHFKKALHKWNALHSNSRAYFLPVGPVHKVFEVLEGTKWHKNYTCEDSWTKLFPYSRLFAKHLKNGTLDKLLEPRIKAMNKSLVNFAVEFTKMSGTNRFEYLDGIDDQFEPRHFAIDCFHLSAQGQRELGDAVFYQIR